VRSVLVTALNLDIGRWMWWPSALAQKPDPAPKELSQERAALVPLLPCSADLLQIPAAAAGELISPDER
jgi:RND superfamily putative drug exporter